MLYTTRVYTLPKQIWPPTNHWWRQASWVTSLVFLSTWSRSVQKTHLKIFWSITFTRTWCGELPDSISPQIYDSFFNAHQNFELTCMFLCRLIDYSLLEAYITELIHTQRKQPYLLSFEHVLRMFSYILQLTRVACTHSDVIRKQVLEDEACLKEICRLLSISYQGRSTKNVIENCWTDDLDWFLLFL